MANAIAFGASRGFIDMGAGIGSTLVALSRPAASPFTEQTAPKRSLVARLAALFSRPAHQRAVARLTDRELADIGMGREMIPTCAMQARLIAF